MGPMEGGPNAIQGKTDPRSAALVPFRSQRHQQRFYIRPVDVGPNRVGKDGAERFLMFANHGLMISNNSIMSSPNPERLWVLILGKNNRNGKLVHPIFCYSSAAGR
jgi:hypothetical protein